MHLYILHARLLRDECYRPMIELLYVINQILSPLFSDKILVLMIEFPLHIFRQTGCIMSSQVSLVCTGVYLKHSLYMSLYL